MSVCIMVVVAIQLLQTWQYFLCGHVRSSIGIQLPQFIDTLVLQYLLSHRVAYSCHSSVWPKDMLYKSQRGYVWSTTATVHCGDV